MPIDTLPAISTNPVLRYEGPNETGEQVAITFSPVVYCRSKVNGMQALMTTGNLWWDLATRNLALYNNLDDINSIRENENPNDLLQRWYGILLVDQGGNELKIISEDQLQFFSLV
jgi:hypothetical protein